jgi:hypothetical protein
MPIYLDNQLPVMPFVLVSSFIAFLRGEPSPGILEQEMNVSHRVGELEVGRRTIS